MSKFAIGMFSSGGIADAGFVKNGIRFLALNELLKDRAALLELNYPESKVFSEDVWECYPKIIDYAKEKLGDEELFLLFATPPCQGMSPNGVGTLLKNIRAGLRPEFDSRNRLVIPALKVAKELKPNWVVFENVPKMDNTIIKDESENPINIIDLIRKELGDEYEGNPYVVEFADYGLPQRRKRLITVFTRNKLAKKLFKEGTPLIPPPFHDKYGSNGLKFWKTLREALNGFEPLDAKNKKSAQSNNDPLHRVPVFDEKKYFWVENTPENESAFDNQCINLECKFQDNPHHGSKRNGEGINQSKKNTPLYCLKCDELLPRPYTEIGGKKRLMFAFISAYKRMSWDLPSSTLTRNFIYACSDNKLHPEENRVLSFAEALRLQSISDYDYKWGPLVIADKKIKVASTTLIRNIIGESAPPMFFDSLSKWIEKISEGSVKNKPVNTLLDYC